MTEQTIESLKKENEILRAAAEESQRKYNELHRRHHAWMDLHSGKLIKDTADTYKLMNQNYALHEEIRKMREWNNFIARQQSIDLKLKRWVKGVWKKWMIKFRGN